MKPVPTLESRIARIAEQYGDGLLRSYATEAGEAVSERDRLRRTFRVFSRIFSFVAGYCIGSGLAQIAMRMGRL